MEEKPVEIKQVSEREIWVGETMLYLGEDNILHETVVGELDERAVQKIYEASIRLRNLIEGKVKIIVDLNKTGRPSSEARNMGLEMLGDERYGKIALFGVHPVARVLASFILGISRKKDARFFKTKEEALVWLKQ